MFELTDEEAGIIRVSGVFGDTMVLDFYSPTCMPCKKMMTILEQIDEETTERADINFEKIDITKNPELVKRFGILTVPTIIVLKGEYLTDKFVGITSKSKIKKAVE